MQQSSILKDTDINDNDDSVEKRIPQNDNPFYPVLSLKSIYNHEQTATTSLIINPVNSEKSDDSEDENLQLQTIPETYAAVIKQSEIN